MTPTKHVGSISSGGQDVYMLETQFKFSCFVLSDPCAQQTSLHFRRKRQIFRGWGIDRPVKILAGFIGHPYAPILPPLRSKAPGIARSGRSDRYLRRGDDSLDNGAFLRHFKSVSINGPNSARLNAARK